MDKNELKEYRDRHGLSQSQLAEIVGVKVGTVQSWEQGKRNVGQSAIKLLQEYDTKEEEKEKTPPEEVRFEDIIASNVVENLKPLLKDFQKGHSYTHSQVKTLTDLVKIMAVRIDAMQDQLDGIQTYFAKECKDIKQAVKAQ